MKPCTAKDCKDGKLVFDGNTTYRCTGKLSEFGNCNKKVKQPERRPVDIPEDFEDGFEFLKREFNPHHHRLLNEKPKAKSRAKATTAKQTLKAKTKKSEKVIKMLLKSKNSKKFQFKHRVLNIRIFNLDKAVVDPDSGLQHMAHVYDSGEKLYSAALTKVDLSVHVKRNSYYILQLLVSDDDDNPKT